MYQYDDASLDTAVVAIRHAVRVADVASLPLPAIKYRLGQIRTLTAALDLYAGRLAAQAKVLHGRQGAAAAADSAGLSNSKTERLTATAVAVDALPMLEDAVLDGSVSSVDAALIADACLKDPLAEERLVDLAKSKHEDLRSECLNVRKNAESDTERAKRHHRNRSFRSWTGEDGETCGRFSLPPEVAAPIVKAIGEEAARLMKARRGELETQDRYAADAFVKLVTEGGIAVKTSVTVAVDLDALREGDTREGERCEIPGIGPVNARWVRSILGDATVNLVIRKGVDVVSVAHLGRRMPPEIMTALLFKPHCCSHPGCANSGYLERDHIVELSRGGATSLDNLQWLCAKHHRQKTDIYTGKHYRPKERGSPQPTGVEGSTAARVSD